MLVFDVQVIEAVTALVTLAIGDVTLTYTLSSDIVTLGSCSLHRTIDVTGTR